jgi:hypothetical protein
MDQRFRKQLSTAIEKRGSLAPFIMISWGSAPFAGLLRGTGNNATMDTDTAGLGLPSQNSGFLTFKMLRRKHVFH